MRLPFRLTDQRGSIAPLGIGLALICLSALLTTAASTSVFVFQRRLQSVADEVALEVGRRALLQGQLSSSENLRTFGIESLRALGSSGSLVRAEVPDGRTLEVVICDQWLSPVGNPFGVGEAEICVSSKARVFDSVH